MDLIYTLEALCCFCVLLTVAFIDYKSRRIPNRLLCLLLFLRVAFLGYLFAVSSENALSCLWDSLGTLLIAIVATALLYPLLNKKTGAGDFKLLLVCGFCFGSDVYLYSLCITCLMLMVFVVIRVVKKQSKSIPFAPFFCVGALIAIIADYILKA